jgi:spermidine synthase
VPRKTTLHEAGRTLVLYDRGTHHELTIGGVPILTSALLGTERAFGRMAGLLRTRDEARVLVGGLGFGATLAGALEVLGPAARVIVVEKLATVIRLVRGELAARVASISKGALDDPRVTLLREDVAEVIARQRDLDVILLDVDNGPEWASFRSNARLYDARGLAAARRALRRGGSWAVWSGYPRDEFVRRLRVAGFTPSCVELKERGRVQARAYVATKR